MSQELTDADRETLCEIADRLDFRVKSGPLDPLEVARTLRGIASRMPIADRLERRGVDLNPWWNLMVAESCGLPDYERAVAKVENPPWGEYDRVHCWRNYIPDRVKEIWPTLDLQSQLALFASAEQSAANEEWD